MKRLVFFYCCASVVFASCGKPKPPQYLGYTNVRLEKAGLAASVVSANLRFFNPNAYALKLKQADLDVFINDRFIGHSLLDSLVVLPGRDSSAVPLRLQVAAKDMLASAAQLLINPNVRLHVKGTAKVGRGSFFVNLPVDYEGTQHIDLLSGDSSEQKQQWP